MILDCLLYNDCSNLNDVLITPQRYSTSCEKKCACICVLKPNRTLLAFWHNLQSPFPSPFVDIPFICPASIRTSHMMSGFNHIELKHEQTVLHWSTGNLDMLAGTIVVHAPIGRCTLPGRYLNFPVDNTSSQISTWTSANCFCEFRTILHFSECASLLPIDTRSYQKELGKNLLMCTRRPQISPMTQKTIGWE
jgi:hypothetical protein